MLQKRPLTLSLCGLLAFVAVLSKRLDLLAVPQFYAEDGTQFFYHAETLGWRSIFTPVSSYLNLCGALLAWLSAALPWEHQPLAYLLGSALVTAYVATRVLAACIPRIPAVIGAIAVAGVPHSGEVFLNLCCVHFVVAVLILLNLLEPAPVSRREGAFRCFELGIAALSGPEVFAFLPLGAWCAWHWRRDHRGITLLCTLCLAAVIQGALIASAPRGSTAHTLPPLALWPLYAECLFAKWLPLPAWGPAALAIAASGAVLVAAIRNRYAVEAVAMLVAAVILLAAGRATSNGWGNPFGSGSRYTYLPFFLFCFALAWLAAARERSLQRIAAAGTLLPVVISAIYFWNGTLPPRLNLNWPKQVREARMATRSEFEVPARDTWKFPVPRISTR